MSKDGILQGCRDHVRLAREHYNRMSVLVEGFMNSDPYTHFVKVDGNGEGKIFMRFVNPFPANEISIELGNMLNHLRSALDECVYVAAVQNSGRNPPPDDSRLEFPILKQKIFNEHAFKIAPLSNRRKIYIEGVQPYHVTETDPDKLGCSVGYLIGVLADWIDGDRFKNPIIYGRWDAGQVPDFDMPAVCKKILHTCYPGKIYDETPIIEFWLEGHTAGMEIYCDCNITLYILLDEVAVTPGLEGGFLFLADGMIEAVSMIIDTMEKY